MKKSELKNYIREEIISTLSEDEKTQQDTKDAEELTAALNDLAKAKQQAGIEEDYASLSPEERKRVGIEYDFEDIGQAYLENMGRPHSLTNKELEILGKKIVDRLYKGDIAKAYDEIVMYDPKKIKEDEDKEPSDSEIKKNKSLAKTAEDLALIQADMRSLARKYSKAKGQEKEDLLNKLKEKTKIKKELESILNKKL
tara:strand:+ start:157 stop:750 length:594 start_codon:yes stop_codon:yes gene_type:complete